MTKSDDWCLIILSISVSIFLVCLGVGLLIGYISNIQNNTIENTREEIIENEK